jgi:methyl-accepting chemotaxis protein
MTLKQKLFLPVSIAILLLGILGYVVMLNASAKLKRHIYTEMAREKQDALYANIDYAAQQALEKTALFSRLPAVIDAYILAHTGNLDDEADPKAQAAREQLRHELRAHLDGYSAIMGGKKLQLHFHLPNGRSLARLWLDRQIQRDGQWLDVSDDISSFRQTVLAANQSGKAIKGVELGRGGFEIRGLVPIQNARGETLGSAEILTDFNSILDNAAGGSGQARSMSLLLYMNSEGLEITHRLSDPAKYPLLDQRYVRVHAAGAPAPDNLLNAAILDQGREGLHLLRQGDFEIGVFPIKDYQGKQIGVIAYLVEISEAEILLQTMLFTLIGVLLLLLLALGGMLYFLSSRLILDPIRQIIGFSEKVRAGDNQLTLDMGTHDEIGQLGNTINRLVVGQRQVLDQIRRAGIQVTSSATELAATSKEQKATLAVQVESTNRVVKSVEEITGVSENLQRTMQQISAMSAETLEFARQGQADLQRMQAVMPQLEDASRAISAKLEAIDEKTENITSVVTTITKVADQTNLLSLNAAIEAEKAGEYGRGFTVVAREIRRLADQTAVATLDIEQMVQQMQSAVSVGVMEMDKFIQVVRHNAEDVGNISNQLTRIITQVQKLLPNFEEVSQAMNHQAQRALQINQEMGELDEGMQQTADSLQEAFLAIEQLNDAVRGLQNEVERLQRDGGESADTPHKVYRGGKVWEQ